MVGLGPSPPLFPSSQSLLPLMISHYHCQEQLGAGLTWRHSQGTHPLELQPSHGSTGHPLDIRRLDCCTVPIRCSPDIRPAIWNCLSLSPESGQQLLVCISFDLDAALGPLIYEGLVQTREARGTETVTSAVSQSVLA